MKSLEHSETLLEACIEQFRQTWADCEKLFFRALEDSEHSRIQLQFKPTLDLSENAPLVTSTLHWKDKATERGISVVKTYSSSTTKKELPDPNQPELPVGPAKELPHGGLPDRTPIVSVKRKRKTKQ